MVRKKSILLDVVGMIRALLMVVIFIALCIVAPLIIFPLSLIYAMSFLGLHITFIQSIQISVLMAIIGAVLGIILYLIYSIVFLKFLRDLLGSK